MARHYSSTSRTGPLSQFRPLSKPGMVGLNLIQQRSLFGGPSHSQLARLEESANNNPNSAAAQASFYSALMRANMPQILIERYDSGKFATNAVVDKYYENAINKAGQSGGQGLSTERVQAVSQAVGHPSQRRPGRKAQRRFWRQERSGLRCR
jgi:ATP-dependent metalloprotease